MPNSSSMKWVCMLPDLYKSLFKIFLWNGIVVLIPSILNSFNALIDLEIASCLVFPHTTNLAKRES